MVSTEPSTGHPSELPAAHRRPYGPWLLVTLCSEDETPTVSVAVSAWATELGISKGKIEFPRNAGNEFVGIGIPQSHRGEYPAAPEAAVLLVADATGGVIESVPELIVPGRNDGPPQAARWHMTLAAPVEFRRATDNVSTRETFVGLTSMRRLLYGAFVAAKNQSDVIDRAWLPEPDLGELESHYRSRTAAGHMVAHLSRRLDTPNRLEPAVPAGGR